MSQTVPLGDSSRSDPVPGRTLRNRLPAGVADATLASLAAFAVGLVAANVFEAAELGVYAVFFAAFMLGTMVVYQLVYVPAEVVAANLPAQIRLGVLRRSLLLGVVPSLIGTGAILLATVATAGIASTDLLVGLTATAWLAALVSPSQDHVRRLLHFRGWSWRAATVSAVQLTVVVCAIIAMALLDVAAAWIPFGALAIANVSSLSVALLLSGAQRLATAEVPMLRFRDLARPGRWLLVQAVLPMASAFIAAWMITVLATPEALGYADAARIAAQPILVLGMGLSAVLSPRAMEAAIARGKALADRTVAIHLGLVGLGGLTYLMIAGASFAWNPMRILVPKAYEVPGLVAATILVNIVIAFLFVRQRDMKTRSKAAPARVSSTVKAVEKADDSLSSDLRLGAYMFLVLIVGLGIALYYFQWQDDHAVLTVRLHSDSQSEPIEYRVYKYQLGDRAFTTLDGILVTVASSERMEVEGL